MELLGALIATNSALTLVEELQIPIDSIAFFCDNTAVLHWIIHKKPTDKWVSNRINTIANTVTPLNEQHLHPSFRYVPTDQNPADIGTRGSTLTALINNDLWQQGPDFLEKPETEWPKMLDSSPENEREIHCYTLNIELTKFPIHQGNSHIQPEQEYESIVPYNNTFSLGKLVTVMQKVMKFAQNLLIKRNTRYQNTPYLWQSKRMKEFAMATINKNEVEKRVISLQYIIQDHYLDAEKRLHPNPTIPPNISQDEHGIYHYKNSYVNKNKKNMPKSLIYIIHKHPLARLIALDSHKSLLHQGRKDMASDIQQKYWIKRITTLTRSVRKSCVTCKRQHGKPYKYPFATALPTVRTQSCRPFQHVGIDYFGPIGYKTETGNSGKLWTMLTTCLITRAVHLEVVPDNTTSSFLLAMRRLVGRRGSPRTIISDNAPAFTLGYAMINADITTMVNSSQTLTAYLASNEIEIRQITPFAPWQGGVYERIVAIVKNMFYKTIGTVSRI
uniref:Integrase catalytic domain-containing protein n=1 Tax=Caenorhabditis japonica TaxID=281687 RepID=A0A8R1E1Y3_CAEJA